MNVHECQPEIEITMAVWEFNLFPLLFEKYINLLLFVLLLFLHLKKKLSWHQLNVKGVYIQ